MFIKHFRIVMVTCALVGLFVRGGVAPVLAQVLPPINDPTPGSTLTTSTATFTGGHAGQTGEQHWLSVGTGAWDHSIFHQSLGTGVSATVSGLFSTGTLFVRYHTYTPVAGWDSQLHTYTMNVAGGTALTITPTTATLGVGGQQMFAGGGGSPAYTFSVVADTSGGATINATTGLYTAGPNGGVSTVRVTDVTQNTADAGVTVTATTTALTITPTTATLGVGGQQMFAGGGGSPAYTFSVVADTSGGATINATTGLYTAGPNGGVSTVRVTDVTQNTADAGVSVTASELDHSTLRWDRKLDSTNGVNTVGFEGCDSDRFKCIFEGTAVVDMETGLVWERFPDIAFGNSSWSQAISHCAIREVGGRKGWSLPLREQLASLVDMTGTGVDLNGFDLKLPNGNPFIMWSGGYYSATEDAEDPTQLWGVRFTDGAVVAYSKSYPNSHIWCVRGGQVYDGQNPD